MTVDPGLCSTSVTPQTRNHTGQSIPGHPAGYRYVMSMNASTPKYLDSNLNLPGRFARPLAHVCSNIDDGHGRWGAHRVATRTTAGGGND